MTLRRFLSILLPALTAALLVPFASPACAANLVIGSGRLQSESRPATAFEAIALHGGMKLILRQAGREAIEVRADDNLLPLVETRVVDRAGVPTLEIGPVRGASWSTRSAILVTIDLVTLKALSISGSGDVATEALKTPSLRLVISGSGDVRLRQLMTDELSIKVSGSGDVLTSGRAGRLAVAIAGSGDVKTDALEADDVTVSIAGSGDASVNARKTLSVTIAGSGDVAYSGEAAVKTSIAGSGTVKRR
jgi:hypothetical protein